jgi:hypothetical protein
MRIMNNLSLFFIFIFILFIYFFFFTWAGYQPVAKAPILEDQGFYSAFLACP